MEHPSSPLVSVITPAFNASAYLAETVESCLRQSHQNLELLIVDDGSIDETAAIAHRYATRDSRVRVFSGPNQGISAARNIAIGNARGSFFALLDSDDLWRADYLEAQLLTLKHYPAAHVVTANAINLGGPLDGMPYWPPSDEVRPISTLDMIVREDAVHIMSVFRRSVIDRIGGFDELRHARGNEDYHFWLRAATAGCCFWADFTPRGYYRRRPDSLSSDERRMLIGIISVLTDIRPRFLRGTPEVEAIDVQLRRFTYQLSMVEARECLANGDPAGAVDTLMRIPQADRGHILTVLLKAAAMWPSLLSHGYRVKRALRGARARPVVRGGATGWTRTWRPRRRAAR